MNKPDKIIQEVDQKLEGDLTNVKKTQQISAIYGQLSSTNRQVNKLLSGMRHNIGRSVPIQNQKQQSPIKWVQKRKQNVINKYNYYGKKYRFQQKQQELNIQPVKIQRQCVSQVNFQKKSRNNSPRTSINGINSNKAIIDQSIFFDDGQIKMPSQNYYIYFDKPEKKALQNYKKSKQHKQIELSKTLPQKFKPAWVMQKKIESLSKELKQMKARQKRRYQNQGTQLRSLKNTFDTPIHLKSNVQRMVQTLWR